MRLSLFSLLSIASLPLFLTSTLAADDSAASKDADDKSANTVFNGIDVPPMKDLSGAAVDEDISKGNWLVEFYSPWCGHCKRFAPILQTAYEYYYTSNPLPGQPQPKDGQDNLNTFTRYYDFKFARLDCVAFADACSAKKVNAWPTLVLFKDGKKVKDNIGELSLPDLSHFIEDSLEAIKPGSRPKDGVKLPEVGAKSVEVGPTVLSAETESKDKDPAAGSAAASAHNAIASKEPEAAGKKEKGKPKATPNTAGTSIELDAAKFQRLVTNTMDPWFIKFYAPWCHHCMAMRPNWAGMAKEMRGKLNIGEVNCEVEKRLCKDARVRGYPTLLYFRGGERVEYDGLRGVGDLISFANKAVVTNSGVEDVDFESFTKMEETEEVIFVYFYDHATTSEDIASLERLTLSLVGHARLVKTKDPKMFNRFKISTWPRLMVSRDGKPTYFTPFAPYDMRDIRKVLTWMKSVWIAIVPELTASNAREIMNGRLVVLGILNRDRADDFDGARREFKNAALEWIDKQTHMMQLERQELRDAKQLRIEEAEDRNDERALRSAKNIRINMDEIQRKQVGFAWVDGVFWERWIRTTYGIDAKEGERVIINDEDNHHYWDTTINGDPIRASRTSILETLRSVTANPPKISPKTTGSKISHFFFRLKNLFTGHPLLMLFASIGAILIAFVAKRKGRSFRGGKREGFFVLGEKDGLLGGLSGGGVTGGKVD